MKNNEVFTRKEYIEREASQKVICDYCDCEQLEQIIRKATRHNLGRGGYGMNKIVKIIGSIVVSILLYAVPILTTCAFTLGWNKHGAYLLTIASLVEFSCLFVLIFYKA